MAKTCSHLPERAKAMAFPPTPANASIMMVFSFGVDSARCAAILLDRVSTLTEYQDNMLYLAIGSGVTPYHESSVIHIPLLYACHIRNLWFQYLFLSQQLMCILMWFLTSSNALETD
jgi:hypothetical protein